MKSTIKFLVIAALVAAIGFSMAACDDKVENTTLEGTWVHPYGEKMILNNGGFIFAVDNVELMKGTYTTSGQIITMIVTHVKGAFFEEEAEEMGLEENQWYTLEEMLETTIEYNIAELVAYIIEEFGEQLSEEDLEELIEELIEELMDELDEFLGDLEYFYVSQTGTYSISGNKLTVIMDGEDPITYTKQ